MSAKTHDQATRDFFEAASKLVQIGLEDVRQSDPDAYLALSEAVAAGAPLVVRTEVNPSGVSETRCFASLADGEKIELFHLAAVHCTVQ